MSVESVDVVVVGGGLAGLTAARTLRRRAPELSVLVLEAKARVGGRTETLLLETAEGGKEGWDLGGQWVGPTQHHLLDLLQDLCLPLYDQFVSGRKLAQLGTEAIRGYSDSLPSNSDLLQYSLWEGVDFLRFLNKAEGFAAQVSLKDPFDHPQAALWDSETVAEWATRHSWTRTLRDSAEAICRSVFGTSAERISMLYFLTYAHGAGSISNLLEAVGDGAQRFRVKGGTQQISRMMADDLGGEAAVRLGRQVLSLVQDSGGVEVRVLHGDEVETYRCRKVLVTAPPQEAAKLRYAPPLPQHRAQLMAALPMGNLLKFVLTYRRAFWRQAGLSGEVVAMGYTGVRGELLPLNVAFDGTTDSGSPALVGFYNSEWGEKAPLVRREALLKDLVRFFGPEALDFVDYADKDWAAEPFSGGCPAGILPPGYMEAMARIREPHGRLHWAGTETATLWPGYMSGAVQSGLRGASEILRDLAPSVAVSEEDLDGSVYAKAYRRRSPKDRSYPTPSLFSLRNVVCFAAATSLVAFAIRRFRLF